MQQIFNLKFRGVKFGGMSYIDLWKTHPGQLYNKWMSFPEIGQAHDCQIEIY